MGNITFAAETEVDYEGLWVQDSTDSEHIPNGTTLGARARINLPIITKSEGEINNKDNLSHGFAFGVHTSLGQVNVPNDNIPGLYTGPGNLPFSEIELQAGNCPDTSCYLGENYKRFAVQGSYHVTYNTQKWGFTTDLGVGSQNFSNGHAQFIDTRTGDEFEHLQHDLETLPYLFLRPQGAYNMGHVSLIFGLNTTLGKLTATSPDPSVRDELSVAALGLNGFVGLSVHPKFKERTLKVKSEIQEVEDSTKVDETPITDESLVVEDNLDDSTTPTPDDTESVDDTKDTIPETTPESTDETNSENNSETVD